MLISLSKTLARLPVVVVDDVLVVVIGVPFVVVSVIDEGSVSVNLK